MSPASGNIAKWYELAAYTTSVSIQLMSPASGNLDYVELEYGSDTEAKFPFN